MVCCVMFLTAHIQSHSLLTSTLAWLSRTNHVFPLTYTQRPVLPLAVRSVGWLRPHGTSSIQVNENINYTPSGATPLVQAADRAYGGWR